jgi:hypothetical protein
VRIVYLWNLTCIFFAYHTMRREEGVYIYCIEKESQRDYEQKNIFVQFMWQCEISEICCWRRILKNTKRCKWLRTIKIILIIAISLRGFFWWRRLMNCLYLHSYRKAILLGNSVIGMLTASSRRCPRKKDFRPVKTENKPISAIEKVRVIAKQQLRLGYLWNTLVCGLLLPQ